VNSIGDVYIRIDIEHSNAAPNSDIRANVSGIVASAGIGDPTLQASRRLVAIRQSSRRNGRQL
jgi:hypothetical protein